MNTLPSLSLAHLLLRLKPLNRALRAAVEAQSLFAQRLSRPDLHALCVTEEQIAALLKEVQTPLDIAQANDSKLECVEENSAEEKLRTRAGDVGLVLPLDRLAEQLELSAFEQQALLLCAAPELNRGYELIYAYILDDLNRRFPCMELLTMLTAFSAEERLRRRHALSKSGKLRRTELLVAFGDPPTESRQEFRLGNEVFQFLTGAAPDIAGLFRDSAEVPVRSGVVPPPQVDRNEFDHLVTALQQKCVSAVGIWGPRQSGLSEVVLALASYSGLALRRLSTLIVERAPAEAEQLLSAQIHIAAGSSALLWLDTDILLDPGHEWLQHLLAERLEGCPVPVVLTGEHPWRPDGFLRADGYVELQLSEPEFEYRLRAWSGAFPELPADEIERLALRFRLSHSDIGSVAKIARTRARLVGNGQPADVKDHLGAACTVITRRKTSHFTTTVVPRRRPQDLVLQTELHRQVLEVATFFQLRQQVDHTWGFGRLASQGGMSALFTGDPGTGKTLAAEVIAGMLGVSLYKVDLARVASKWVGETEKNIDAAFREAEDSQSVLFFDEAEALFGKRAEITHGADRWANLEVSFLLQRLESTSGLVILASNIKDQIDAAFTRRFQVALHFPKPALPERRRIWQIAFPSAAPLDTDVDFDALARLTMSGAGIMSASRSAALLAADAGCTTISMAHVIRAVARQYRREARVLTASELGSYAPLLQEAS